MKAFSFVVALSAMFLIGSNANASDKLSASELKEAKQIMAESCAKSFMAGGTIESKEVAMQACMCVADAVEKEFGFDDPDSLMKATQKASSEGNEKEKKIFEITLQCYASTNG